MAKDFFSKLFSASSISNVEDVCSHIRRRLNSNQIALLSQLFSLEEVEGALKQLGPLKAPGSDGLPVLFFQKYWKIVGKEVTNLVLDVLNNKKSPKEINHTLIALIPK